MIDVDEYQSLQECIPAGMRTTRSLTVSRSICRGTCMPCTLLPDMPPCHTCSPCHICPCHVHPLSCMPPTTHAVLPHTPLPHMPPLPCMCLPCTYHCYVHPPPHMPPCHVHPPPLQCMPPCHALAPSWTDRHLLKHNLRKLRLRR